MFILASKHSLLNDERSKEERIVLVVKVLAGDSVNNVTKETQISSEQLYQWVIKYRETGVE